MLLPTFANSKRQTGVFGSSFRYTSSPRTRRKLYINIVLYPESSPRDYYCGTYAVFRSAFSTYSTPKQVQGNIRETYPPDESHVREGDRTKQSRSLRRRTRIETHIHIHSLEMKQSSKRISRTSPQSMHPNTLRYPPNGETESNPRKRRSNARYILSIFVIIES
jgi:hypothetical protein